MTRRILVADDSSTIQKVIKIAFSQYEIELVEAASYFEALNLLREAKPGPEALILDASLPGVKGPQDFQKLRSRANQAPVLLLAGSYESIDEGAFQGYGFKHFLKKPFDSSEIVRVVNQLLTADVGGRGLLERSPSPGAAPDVRRTGMDGPAVDSVTSQPDSSLPAPPPADFDREELPSATKAVPDQSPLPPPPTVPSIDEYAFRDSGGKVTQVPAPPLTEEGRRGRKAFDGEGDGPVEGTPAGGKPAFGDPAADRGFDQSTFAVWPEPEPAMGTHFPNPVPPPTVEGVGGGGRRPADLAQDGLPTREALAEALQPMLDERLPVLVREAVEAYCHRHFKSLAREMIAQELRRLADEKARHLVDQ